MSQLDRATPEDLKEAFGQTEFRLARGREEIDRSMNTARVGQELFPYLMMLLVVVLAFEQVLSNRFYQDYDTARQPSRAAQLASRVLSPKREGAKRETAKRETSKREPPQVGASSR
mgnify:CR=1 FL=1